ncbi:ROK family transcriptional regulator [Pseudonocardia sp. MH-G8]|uniref:ROK family transcriptional regulator n=1 Tax=Pseudonocardia sp. MH-G8 TaxID=1854588 RepID=UPI000BA09352|nr:ROK family transcriptional regulator [Pseudonocardia sp. MH-G8]OZM78864.1 transcriptional regulator [Pseudonocardia sp. MH-G8]
MTDTSHGSLQSLRQGNRDRVAELLREHGRLHRAELARRTGLSRTTISTIVSGLLADGTISEADGDGDGVAPGTGRRKGLLSLNPDLGVVLGVDVSLSTVRVVVADTSHRVLQRGVTGLAGGLGWADRLDQAADLARSLVEAAGRSMVNVVGAGLGVPGPVNQDTGEVAASSNSLEWEGVRAAEELGRRLGVAVALDNTSHLGSLAEVVWGAGQGCRNVLYLKIANGIGAGFLIDGRIFRGAVGAAGEIGHIAVDDSGPACRCGNRGCLEVYTAVPAVLQALRPMYGDLTLSEALRHAEDGDRACRRVLADTGLLLGRTLAGVSNLLNPELVIIGGELAMAGELLLGAVRTSLARHALPIISGTARVVPGQLGDDAGALGGVALVLREADRLVASS